MAQGKLSNFQLEREPSLVHRFSNASFCLMVFLKETKQGLLLVVFGIDYKETFGLVIKATTICIVLTISLIKDIKVCQINVNDAFLYEDLDEEFYIELQPGYEERVCVCHLNSKVVERKKQVSRKLAKPQNSQKYLVTFFISWLWEERCMSVGLNFLSKLLFCFSLSIYFTFDCDLCIIGLTATVL